MRRRPSIPGSRRRSGFTLVEVISALIIFSVAVVALIEGLGVSSSFQSGLVSRQRAAMLAQNVLEEIVYSGDLESGDQTGQFDGVDAEFDWETEVTETETPRLKEVRVWINWKDGGDRSFELRTLIEETSAL